MQMFNKLEWWLFARKRSQMPSINRDVSSKPTACSMPLTDEERERLVVHVIVDGDGRRRRFVGLQ